MKKINLFEPHVGAEEVKAATGVVKSKFWASGAGVGNVKKFEEHLSKYTGARSCVAVNSGTAALHLALSTIDVRNKEVIVPSMSFVSTAHAVVYNGGRPVFVDIEPDSLCMDPQLVEKKITKKTAAILPVHFGGMAADLKALQKISKDHGLSLVEDAAHACGSKFNGRNIGSHGDFVCFSFHPVKNLSMPTGGAVCVNTKFSIEKLHSKRWCGITDRKNGMYDVKELGWNFYMNEISASIGIVQLKKLEKLNQKRKKIATQYSKKINTEAKMPIKDGCSYHLYWILVKNRDKFRKKLLDEGIETGVHYTPIHKMSMYKQKERLPVTEDIGASIVTLPMHPNLSDRDIERVIQSVNSHM
ncbi:MAG: DegT/DnrJ/EryC1/StrS family aminotransferase [Nitrosarchaeum sp.]|nr:DegT/DnrJ/EryC1/StrS family aminotransferase [Nitrosarchaeum sp.]MCA9819707.1 DegT/DnrJ/EryC1/StrS family aminotransferase [Nitrosarchaeum sp.]